MAEEVPLREAMGSVLSRTIAQMRQTLAENAATADTRELLGAGALIRDVEALAGRVASGWTVSFAAPAGGRAGVNAGVPSTAAGSDAIVGYGLEEHPRKGPFLCEYRDGAAPFRSPRRVYDATIRVLLRGGGRGVDFAKIHEGVAIKMGAGQSPDGRPIFPDYAVRVPLRFWMRLERPLILRERARFRVADPATFAADALAAWDALPRK